VVDGRGVTCTNITEEEKDRTMSIFNVRPHLLSQGDGFDLLSREPITARTPLEPSSAPVGHASGRGP
jgi:cyanophycinase